MYKISGIILILLCFSKIYSQPDLVITNLEEVEDKLIINYDIKNFEKNELFDISVRLSSKKNVVVAKNITGDITKVRGGNDYKIVWDLIADSIYINDEVEIQLNAKIFIDISNMKYSSLMLYSTLLPGWGLKKIDNKNRYCILGILGYAALGASLYFYTQGNSSYNGYKQETDPVTRINLLDEANRNKHNATIAGFTASGLWLLNYVWFTINWQKKKSFLGLKNKVHLFTNFNPNHKQTFFTISYTF